jgi:predicted Zn finger-like uncharacterized protein
MSSAIRSMHIVCPNCTTSYAVNPASFGDTGRTVRCARCKEVWLAHPEDLSRTEELVPAAMASAPPAPEDDLSAWGVTDDDSVEDSEQDTPVVDSPSIAAGWPDDSVTEDANWTARARDDHDSADDALAARFGGGSTSRLAWLSRLKPSMPQHLPFNVRINANIACVALGALVAALLIWRTDVVRLMPQTATFYSMVGLDVNLRGLAFKDIKVATETVDGKPVLVIEGNIVSETRKPTAMPRLRFIVRDAHGSEIYAWSAVLEQPGLNPGDKAWFRSRLASPPADGRNLDIRFFNKNDIGA